MSIPKWLVALWAGQVLFSAGVYYWTTGFVNVSELAHIAPLTLVSWVYWGVVGVTIAWFLASRATAIQRFYMALWVVALLVATAGGRLAPAGPGNPGRLPYVVPPVAIGVAAMTMLGVWLIRKHRPRGA